MFKFIFLYVLFFLTLALFLKGCSNLQNKLYVRIPDDVHKHAEKVCKKIDGSHFIVRNQRVWLKKKDKSEIELKHFKSILPDGYYFCSSHERDSEIID